MSRHVIFWQRGAGGSRTRLYALKGRNPMPIDERAIRRRAPSTQLKYGGRVVFTLRGGRCSNPRLLVFSQALSHLSYQPNEKGPMSLRHRALYQEPWQSVDGPVSQAHGIQRHIGRLIGKSRCTCAFDGTGPYQHHGNFSACVKYLVNWGSNRAAVLHSTPQDPERFRRVRKNYFLGADGDGLATGIGGCDSIDCIP